MKNLKLIMFGCNAFSEEMLNYLLMSTGHIIKLVLTIPEKFNISYSKDKVNNCRYSNITALANSFGIPNLEVDSIDGKRTQDYYEDIKMCDPDIILVLGWYYKVPKKIRDLAKYGTWGIHPSLLPKYAGGAPLTWAIINGETETGATLFRLDDGVDDGDIINQKKIKIDRDDTIKEVYDKITGISKLMLGESLSNADNIVFTPQDKTKIEIWPQRSPDDGKIDLNKKSEELYNFIRAQSNPYPGAFIKTIDGKKLIIEKARIE